MSIGNDDFVEDLIKGLPKAEPMSEFEIRKFEKLIDRQAEEFSKSKRSSSFKLPTSIAASIAIVFGAVLLLTNHAGTIKPLGGITQTASPQPSSNATQDEGSTTTPTQNSTSGKSKNGGNSKSGGGTTQEFGNSNTSNGSDGSVAKFATNLDYSTDLSRIKKLVTLPNQPGTISSLENSARQCAIKQGISDSILAFDKGYFQGQRVSVYYSGANKNDYKTVLVDSDCNIVLER
jgi:hypothetical protein